MWLDKLTIVKTGKKTGVASIKLIDEEDNSLTLNKLFIDFSDGSDPVQVLKHEGCSVFSGSFVNSYIDYIVENFQVLIDLDVEEGIYIVNSEGIEQL